MKKIVTAIIGYGMSGRYFHLPPLEHHSNYQVKYIMTKNNKRKEELNQKYPSIEIITDYNQALNDLEIDLIIVATSNDVHYKYAKLALLNHKHVVVEKPFVQTYEQAKELYDLAEKQNRTLRVFHNRQYDGDILTIRELIKTHDFGKITSFKSRFDTYNPNVGDAWREQDGTMPGVYFDLAPHIVDHAVRLFGVPHFVYASLFKDKEQSQVDDHFEMILYYDEVTCFLGASQLTRAFQPRFELTGTKSTYIKYGFDNPDQVYYKPKEIHQTSGLKSQVLSEPNQSKDIPLLLGKHYLFYDTLAQHIDKKPTKDIDKICALQVVSIMECGLKSHEQKKAISIPKEIHNL